MDNLAKETFQKSYGRLTAFLSKSPKLKRHSPNSTWGKNAVQFPRLIAELWGIGLTKEQRAFLKEQMDITGQEIDELFERADREWQRIKNKEVPPHSSAKH